MIVNKTQKSKQAKVYTIYRELIASILWSYLIIKLIFFDIDYYLLDNYGPSYLWLVKYKFFIGISLLSITWLITGKKFKLLLGFILSYPFIIVFWRIPKLLFKTKSWFGIFISIGTVASFIKSFKTNFILFSIVCISCLLILINNNAYLLILSLISLIVFLMIHYVRRIKYSFHPSHIFKTQSDVIEKVWNFVENGYKVPDDLKGKSQLTKPESDKIFTNIQVVVIFNKICYFLSSKLTEVAHCCPQKHRKTHYF